MSDGERRLFVDASVFITLAEIGETELLASLAGAVQVPEQAVSEITTEPARSRLCDAETAGWFEPLDAERTSPRLGDAAGHLGVTTSDQSAPDDVEGDVALLACALAAANPVVVTDDKPLRKACKALSIPVSGSIAVLVRAVERGDLPPETAKKRLYAMDEVGARLSASLVKREERLTDDAA